MSIISNTIVAFSMSADAFAASVCKGVSLKRPKLSHAVRIGMVFGAIETLTPVIGWLLGVLASGMIASVDHWVAFVLLSIIGGKMVYEGFHKNEEECKETHKISVLIITAIGTSIDAMAVGATLAFLKVDIWIMAAMIGTATFIMATIGVMTGHYIGKQAGKAAEIIGGICLFAIGAKILIEHTAAIGV